MIIARTTNQNCETLKVNEITEPPVQDPLVTQIGNCFEKFADALGQHMTTLSNRISKNVTDAMNTSDNPRLIRRKEPKSALIPLGLRTVKQMKSTAGVRAKSREIIHVGISPKNK